MKKIRIKIALIAIFIVILGVVGILSCRDRNSNGFVHDANAQQEALE